MFNAFDKRSRLYNEACKHSSLIYNTYLADFTVPLWNLALASVHRPWTRPVSTLGDWTKIFIPHSKTSERTKAPDGKYTYGFKRIISRKRHADNKKRQQFPGWFLLHQLSFNREGFKAGSSSSRKNPTMLRYWKNVTEKTGDAWETRYDDLTWAQKKMAINKIRDIFSQFIDNHNW